MPDILGLLADEKVQRALAALKARGFNSIDPVVEFNFGVKYPALNGIFSSSEEAREVLLLLSGAGILISEIVDNFSICPRCQSHRLMIRTRCPSCGSSRLVRDNMIEHLTCGHIDFEGKFKSEEGLFCPNCRKPLLQAGSDYRTFSFLYKCLNCKSVFSDPKIEYLCDNGHVFGENDLRIYNVMVFKVNPEKKFLIDRLTLNIEDFLKPLIDEGLSIKAPAVIYGRSGARHIFSFAIWRERDAAPSVVGHVHLLERAVGAVDVLAFWAKATDANVEHKIIITFSGVDSDGRSLAKAYGLKIIEGRNEQDIFAEVRSYLKEILGARRLKEALVE
ncbi:MAG: hypothetical protein QW424_01860 [Candidatus Bathyarchaeia archaeon]